MGKNCFCNLDDIINRGYDASPSLRDNPKDLYTKGFLDGMKFERDFRKTVPHGYNASTTNNK